MDPAYTPDPSKLAAHTSLNQSPQRCFIRSRAGVSRTVHLGLRRDHRGDRSGLILSVGYVAACSGKQIGGPWGYTRWQAYCIGSDICTRCARYAGKHAIDLTGHLL